MRHAEDGCLTLAKKEVYCNNTERVALQRRLPEDDAWCSGAPTPTRKTGAAPKAAVFCIPGPRSKRVFPEVCTSQSLPPHVFAFRVQRDLLRLSSWRRSGQMLCRHMVGKEWPFRRGSMRASRWPLGAGCPANMSGVSPPRKILQQARAMVLSGGGGERPPALVMRKWTDLLTQP